MASVSRCTAEGAMDPTPASILNEGIAKYMKRRMLGAFSRMCCLCYSAVYLFVYTCAVCGRRGSAVTVYTAYNIQALVHIAGNRAREWSLYWALVSRNLDLNEVAFGHTSNFSLPNILAFCTHQWSTWSRDKQSVELICMEHFNMINSIERRIIQKFHWNDLVKSVAFNLFLMCTPLYTVIFHIITIIMYSSSPVQYLYTSIYIPPGTDLACMCVIAKPCALVAAS